SPENSRVRLLSAGLPLGGDWEESDVPSEPEEKPERILVELDGDSERVRVLGANLPLGCQGKSPTCRRSQTRGSKRKKSRRPYRSSSPAILNASACSAPIGRWASR